MKTFMPCGKSTAREGGKLVYSEGEYYHYMEQPIPSYKEWRVGLPPQWYPTHSNAYYVCVTGGSFTEVSCAGMPSLVGHVATGPTTAIRNRFGTEIALTRTSEGGMSHRRPVGTPPASAERLAVCAGRRVRSMGNTKGSKNPCPTQFARHFRPAFHPAAMADRTAI